MKRIAIYARVSTEGQTTEPQLHSLREYAQRRALETVEYIDEAVSGRRDSRPALDQLLAAVRRRQVDAVAVVKLDRLARSVAHLVRLAGELEALGVDLVVLDQGIDTSTPAGKLTFHVLAALAEFERDLIVERTRAGLDAARRRGARIGRPEVTDRRSRDRIVRLRKAGHSLRKIAGMVEVSAGTVVNILKKQAA